MDRRDFLKGTVAAAVVAATTTVAAEAATTEALASGKPVCWLTHRQVFQPKTADELVEQMRRWRAGEFDRHDAVVAVWRDRAQKRHPQVENSPQMQKMQRWWHKHGPNHFIPKDYEGNPMWGTPEETGAKLADQYKAWLAVGVIG
jgi:hypothetical protein